MAIVPLWVGLGIFAFMMATGERLLIDPDTLWQITVGNDILAQHAVPRVDAYSFTMRGEPWISTQWLSQVIFAASHNLLGWTGPVLVTSLAAALTFGFLARILQRDFPAGSVVVFVVLALALMLPHTVARPHLLAMPVMVAWTAMLTDAMERRAEPPWRALAVIALWANLHGGFVLGIALIGPVALDVLAGAALDRRARLFVAWAGFGGAAVIAACINPYGWEAFLASYKIMTLGNALTMISEWRPADFSGFTPFGAVLIGGIGLALWRGVRLPPLRVVMLLGLLHLALSHQRNFELLALLAPILLAKPLAAALDAVPDLGAREKLNVGTAGILSIALAAALVVPAIRPYRPHPVNAPAAAVAKLKELGVARVFNSYDYGGYLIANGVAPFIDGRTELYGEAFTVDYDRAALLRDPALLLRILDRYAIDATLLQNDLPSALFLDQLAGWRKVYSDAQVSIHMRSKLELSDITETWRLRRPESPQLRSTEPDSTMTACDVLRLFCSLSVGTGVGPNGFSCTYHPWRKHPCSRNNLRWDCSAPPSWPPAHSHRLPEPDRRPAPRRAARR